MVQHTKFSLELIDAESKIPFKEHVHRDGKTYAEVEPDMEYFLRIKSSDPRTITAKLFVDGKDLGYTQPFEQHQEATLGLWHSENGVGHHAALRFNKLFSRRNTAAASSESDPDEGHWTGCVEVKVLEKIFLEGNISRTCFSSKWTPNTDHVLKGLTVSSNKKAVNSMEGSAKTNQIDVGPAIRNWKYGKELASLKLYYCSTVGLIAAKILAPPPAPDVSQIRGTINDNDDDEIEIEEKTRAKKRRGNENAKVETRTLVRTQTLEVLDLTNDDEFSV